MNNNQLTDSCPMPFGKHLGKDMEDVPAAYLLYIHDKNLKEFKAGKTPKGTNLFRVMEYCEDNMQVLEKQRDESLKYGGYE